MSARPSTSTAALHRAGSAGSAEDRLEWDSKYTRRDDDGQLHSLTEPAVVLKDGTEEWWVHGQLHREDDLPAVIQPNGTQEWWSRGALHRMHGPAIIGSSGCEEWYAWGDRHRAGGLPAITFPDGSEEYWVEGNRNREDGPAVVYYSDVRNPPILLADPWGLAPNIAPSVQAPHQEWWQDGLRHRLDGPAVLSPDGSQEWFKEGELHRVGGPAIDSPSYGKEWWVDGRRHRLDGPAVTGPDEASGTVPTGGKNKWAWWVNGSPLIVGAAKAADRAHTATDLTDEEAFALLNEFPLQLIATLIIANQSATLSDRSRGFASLLL